MNTRCYNTRNADYKNYGARGITVCDDWRHVSFHFIDWAIAAGGWREGLELDRIDNDGPYSPSNCRFVDRSRNQLNTRRTVLLSDGRVMRDVARENGICEATLQARLNRGWSRERAALTPPQTPGKYDRKGSR